MNLQEQVSRIKQVMKLNESEDNKSEDYDLVFSLFDDFTRGANIYYNPETESIWMIFPEEKKWVFELENDGDLWYNYHFFVDVFKYLSLDVIDNQHYITEWVEDTIKRGVNNTYDRIGKIINKVEDTLKRGVNNTTLQRHYIQQYVDDTLKKGKKLNNDESK
jgi:hypothetical protein